MHYAFISMLSTVINRFSKKHLHIQKSCLYFSSGEIIKTLLKTLSFIPFNRFVFLQKGSAVFVILLR